MAVVKMKLEWKHKRRTHFKINFRLDLFENLQLPSQNFSKHGPLLLFYQKIFSLSDTTILFGDI